MLQLDFLNAFMKFAPLSVTVDVICSMCKENSENMHPKISVILSYVCDSLNLLQAMAFKCLRSNLYVVWYCVKNYFMLIIKMYTVYYFTQCAVTPIKLRCFVLQISAVVHTLILGDFWNILLNFFTYYYFFYHLTVFLKLFLI